MVGRRVAVGAVPIVLGRDSTAFGPSVFDGGSISRAHARVFTSSHGEARLEDSGSRNGTFLNSVRVDSAPLANGDVIAVGNILLLLTREPSAPTEEAASLPDIVARSSAMSGVLRAVHAATSRGPCLIFGESGVGKSALANAVHLGRRRAGSLRTFRGAAANFEFEPKPGDTWLVESFESLPQPAQADLLEWLPSLATSNTTLVCCSCSAPEELREDLDPRLINRICRWSIEVPALRTRRADIMPLAIWFAERYRGGSASFDAELAYALLRHSWPGNLHELEAVVERAVVESPEAAPITSFPGLATILLSPPGSREVSSIAALPSTPPARVAADGSWFWAPNAERVDLSRREVLRRVLAGFAEAHRRWPGRSMTVHEVVDRGWPGERMTTKAGANRAYVALATLRKLGLRDALIRDEAGYSLETTVVVEDD